MARLRRIVMPGHAHVVIHRGRSGQAVFRDAADRETYRSRLREVARHVGVTIHAYALLPSEVRLLVVPETATGLADLMQGIGRHYVRAFNRKYQCTGTPWEGRFRSTVVEGGSQFLNCMRFVEAAPAESPEKPIGPAAETWSSAAHHLGLRLDPLVVDHPAFWALGNTPFEREAAYRRLAAEPFPDRDVAAILHAALNGWVIGSTEFADAAGWHAGRRPQPAKRGRPKRVAAA